MNPAGAVIPAQEAAERVRAHGGSFPALLQALLPWAASYANAPVSQFTVGAVALGGSGAVYAGANHELAGLPLAASVHAEQSVVANAWLHGEHAIAAIAVTAPPCGHCRQFLTELRDAATLQVIVADGGGAPLAELLPEAFGPSDLGVAERLLDPADHRLSLDARDADPLAAAALAAANASYAPYTAGFAGVAVRMHDSAVVTGRYAESAAFNPSLPALQAAISMLALRRERLRGAADVVLVEAEAATSQRSAAEALLGAAGGPPLRYLRAWPRPGTFPGQNGS